MAVPGRNPCHIPDTSVLGTQGSTDFPVGRLTQTKATTYFPAPDNTQGSVTEQMQYDKRGRPINASLLISASGGNLSFPTLPTYQQALSYNDADQLTTTTTSSNPSGLGYTFTNFYDSTTGVPTGLGNNSSTANLATQSYNANALLDTLSLQTSTGTALANEQFSYDSNLRPTGATASWQSGSGNTGTIYSQTLTYDAGSNVTSATTTQAAVPGQTGSGGSGSEVYCYDEQNRLLWAGNTGTPPAAGNGTCGSGTPSNSLSGATYSNQYSYTHLGQLWQGPYNGSGSYQYLYCNTSQPHQLTGLYPSGTTCSTTGGQTQTYGASYDAWGNMTTRTATGTGGTTANLTYDGQDHLVRWNDTNTTSNEEWYLYDASGQRVLRRSQQGGASNTTLTVYAFGLEEHQYSYTGSGSSATNTGNTYYYSLGGHLIGTSNGTSTSFLLTDALGSVVSSLSNTANNAAVNGNQTYGPYGNQAYSKGTVGTNKGYTGKYNDALTQLDYYGARYYDPFVGVFLSADTVQGNLQGMSPYGYVNGNPETYNDPTGQYFAPPGNGGNGGPPPSCTQLNDCNPTVSGGGNNLPEKNPSPSSGGAVHHRHLTTDQLNAWCFLNTRCYGALENYIGAQERATYEQDALMMMAFFAAFDGDPEAFQQVTEEDTLMWQQMAEGDDVSLDDAVSAKLTSDDPGQRVEGEAGAIASQYSKLIRFNLKFGKNGEYGEVDAETPEAIIEAKSGALKGKISDLIAKSNNIAVNPDGKPFVIYAPDWTDKNAQTVYETVGNLDTGQQVYVTTSPAQLIEVLEYLQEAAP